MENKIFIKDDLKLQLRLSPELKKYIEEGIEIIDLKDNEIGIEMIEFLKAKYGK